MWMQSRDIPALLLTRTEIAVFERGFSVRRDALATGRNRIRAREFCCERASRGEEIVAQREVAEIVRGRIAHPADRDPDRIRIATARMRRVGCVTGPYVAHVPPQVVRRYDAGARIFPERDAEMIGGIDGREIATRPMQIDPTKIAPRQFRERGHRNANVVDVNPIDPEHPPTPGDHPASGRRWKAASGTAVGIGLFFAKFKSLLFALLNLKWLLFGSKFLLTGFSFLASIFFYAAFFGWKFGIVFVLLIAVHELGHVIFVRGYGFKTPAMVFVPGLGAFTTWNADGKQTVYQESVIAFGGPLLGTLGGLVCFAYGAITNEPFWYAAANTAFFLNLFNMIPLGVFDGGRMTGAISPVLWIAGFVLVIVAAIAFHWWSPILLLIVIFSIPRVVSVWRGTLDSRFYAVTARERIVMSIAYFGLLAVLLACLVFTRVAVPGHALG